MNISVNIENSISEKKNDGIFLLVAVKISQKSDTGSRNSYVSIFNNSLIAQSNQNGALQLFVLFHIFQFDIQN